MRKMTAAPSICLQIPPKEYGSCGMQLRDLRQGAPGHHPLPRALEANFMTTKELTRRQARWAEKLAEFNFKILYQSGAKNHKADAVTRIPGYRPDSDEDDRKKHQRQI